MKQALILCLGIFMFSMACKKEKDPSLTGKWNIENSILMYYEGGALVDNVTQPGNGATMDFQQNGKVVIADGIGGDTLSYKILTGSKVLIDVDTFEIKNLTAPSVTLSARGPYGTDGYQEVTLNLKR
jgi:hypothetical protein